jgi:dihydroorotate dehydrogenase (fumarate)
MSIDLTTKYLGLTLKNPLVVASCPMAGDIDTLRQAEEAGAAAAILPSLFEEQIELEDSEVNKLYEPAESYAESLSHFPELEAYTPGSTLYLEKIENAKKAVSIPIMGSLNGISTGGWTRHAKSIQEAGADALELNIYFVPTDPKMTAGDLEKRYVDLVANVRATVSIPICVKIGPFFTALPSLVQQIIGAGANGLVLFNRYLEPDLNLETLEVAPNLVLSSRHELRLALRWIAILRDQVDVSIAATGGVHFAEDVIKAVLVGADATQMAAVLMRYGPTCISKLLSEIEHWLEENDYESIEQMKGSMSHQNCPNPSALERANYMKAILNFSGESA